jgi:prolyl 4-hydroxylase
MTAARVLRELEEDDMAVVDGFLSPTECAQIMWELECSHWWRSSVVKYNGSEDSPAYFSDMRTSETSGQIWFSDELKERLAAIEDRLADLLATTTDRFEEWQATRYGPGESFDFHVDGGNWERSAAGERKRSIILYIEEPLKRGETFFRALGRSIEPRAGRALVWNNLLPSGKCNFAMIHAGLPVEAGRKTILVSWERERPLRV